MYTGFDVWVEKNEKNGRLIVPDNKNGEIYGALFFEHLMEVIKKDGNLDEFIAYKNNKLRDLYVAENSKPIENEISGYSKELNELNNFSVKSRSLNAKINNFEADVDVLLQMYPPERHIEIKRLLENYVKEGNFDYSYALNKLKSKPNGFLAKLKDGKKIKKANSYLDTFINKYEKMNIKKDMDDLSSNKNYGMLQSLKSKFDAVSQCDKKRVQRTDENFVLEQTKLNNQISYYQQKIEEEKAKVKKFDVDFTQSYKIEAEKDVIKSFVKEVKSERENPKELNVSDYVECLDKIPDSEMVVFNVGLSEGYDVLTKINNIMKQNGLACGYDVDKWLIRKDTTENLDKGRYELFSPILTAKQAKKIMPKLMADFDKANVSSGLAIPMKASDLIEKTSEKTELTQDGLLKLVGGAIIKEKIEDPIYNDDNKIAMEQLGIKSESELPEAFFSLNEIMEKFPKDKYLFSGTTASDDYLPFSARAGRNGTIYATPHLSYAAKYDGVTTISSTEADGKKVTGDKYVSSIVGKVLNKDVKVGFINIYEQSPDDKYFPNFGMESCKKVNIKGDKGYKTDPKAETYVTPDKNPLKAKIMHFRWDGKEFFIPVPKEPTETMKAILDMRQAKMKDTFLQNDRNDVYTRFQNQAKDFVNKTNMINRVQNLSNDGR